MVVRASTASNPPSSTPKRLSIPKSSSSSWPAGAESDAAVRADSASRA